MPWTFGHTCQSTVWQPACQYGEAYSGRDKRYTVPAFTLLHCALLGADLGEICNSKQLFEKNIFSSHEYRIWEAGFKLHIATTGDHFVFSLPLAVSNVEDLRMAAMTMYLRSAVPTVYFVFSFCQPGKPVQANRELHMFQCIWITNWNDEQWGKAISALEGQTPHMRFSLTECSDDAWRLQ